MKARHQNDGLRKICGCPRRGWAKCEHPWHFNFKWQGTHHRYSLDKLIGKAVRAKTAAKAHAEGIRIAIREGTFRAPGSPEADKPQRDTLTLAQLFETFTKRYLEPHRAATLATVKYQIGKICRTEIERADGTVKPFGAWLVADISTETIELYRAASRPHGLIGTNRNLGLLRSMFNWASSSKRNLVTDNPFRDGAQAAIRFGGKKEEQARTRRLRPGEGEKLLAACNPHLRALVEAALETGCRRGELLSLQWWQVRFEPKAEIFLPAIKTKTKKDRRVPISSRLRPLLEMRRTGPDGQEHPAEGYVFGNEVGERVGSVKRAWERAVLKAHGHRPGYVAKQAGEKVIKTAALDPESREALRRIDLNFHDLRREAGSRWLDGGVPLHRVQMWLGHSNIAQTSTYLRAEAQDDDLVMRRYEAQQTALQAIATESKTGGHPSPSSDTNTDSETPKRTEIH